MKQGRHQEAARIRRADKAAAVGRLMLGEFSNLDQFFQVAERDYEKLPRRALKAGVRDVRDRLTSEITSFCKENFEGMTEAGLARLYDEIAPSLRQFQVGAVPLHLFEERYARVRRQVLRGAPVHCTVVISVRGLQLRFPEDLLSKDLIAAMDILKTVVQTLGSEKNWRQSSNVKQMKVFDYLARQEQFASRACIIGAFNLLEAYLNGLAWEYSQNPDWLSSLSERQRKLVEDTSQASIRDKLLKYPTILGGKELWRPEDPEISYFIDFFKPFRDSLVHPSPFPASERFGGYDKLSRFYGICTPVAVVTVGFVADLISQIHKHLYGDGVAEPPWLVELRDAHQDEKPSDLYEVLNQLQAGDFS